MKPFPEVIVIESNGMRYYSEHEVDAWLTVVLKPMVEDAINNCDVRTATLWEILEAIKHEQSDHLTLEELTHYEANLIGKHCGAELKAMREKKETKA